MKISFQLAFLFFALIIQLSGQLVGSCPSNSARSPQDIKELRGVVVDENLAVVPKVKVKLQVPVGQDFHDVALIETDRSGQF